MVGVVPVTVTKDIEAQFKVGDRGEGKESTIRIRVATQIFHTSALRRIPSFDMKNYSYD